MKWIQNLLMVAAVASLASCVENEKSLFIEHAKMSPDFPDCTVSAGDEEAAAYSVNLFLAGAPVAPFYVTNAIMSQEDYGTLTAQSNGVLIDGYELYTLIPGEGAVGGTEYFEYNSYLDPESSDILFADIMSQTSLEAIRGALGCTVASPAEIGDAIIAGDMGMRDTLEEGRMNAPPVMYAVVRFMGHTQGGKNVQTQEFSLKLNTYCGMANSWYDCFSEPCVGLCSSDGVYQDSCSSGVNQVMRCQDYLAGYGDSIPATALDGTNGTYCSVNCGG